MEEGAAAVCVNSRALLTQLHTELSAETSTVISAAHSSFYTLLLPLLLSLLVCARSSFTCHVYECQGRFVCTGEMI